MSTRPPLPDLLKPVSEKDELLDMLDKYVPAMLKPDVLPGFSGADLVSDAYLKKHFLSDDIDKDAVTMVSVSINLAEMKKSAGIATDTDQMYIIFLRENLPWGHTFFCLLEEICRISLVNSKSPEFAESKQGETEATRTAFGICQKLYPDDCLTILRIHKETLAIIKGAPR